MGLIKQKCILLLCQASFSPPLKTPRDGVFTSGKSLVMAWKRIYLLLKSLLRFGRMNGCIRTAAAACIKWTSEFKMEVWEKVDLQLHVQKVWPLKGKSIEAYYKYLFTGDRAAKGFKHNMDGILFRFRRVLLTVVGSCLLGKSVQLENEPDQNRLAPAAVASLNIWNQTDAADGVWRRRTQLRNFINKGNRGGGGAGGYWRFRHHEVGGGGITWTLFAIILSQQLASFSSVNPARDQRGIICQRWDLHLTRSSRPGPTARVPKTPARLPDTRLTKRPRNHLMAVLSQLYRPRWYATDHLNKSEAP